MRHAGVIEYDGGGFRGWQRQPAARTVQGELEYALSRVADHPVRVVCAGRTDAGVHATGQVVHFDTDADRPDRAWVLGTNSHLSSAVAVRWAAPVPQEFNARHSALVRSYRYWIASGRDRPALWRERVGWCSDSLDVDAMRKAGRYCLGEQDFSAFRAADCQSTTPMRRVDSVDVRNRGDWVAVDVVGNAFLHNMVRILVGSLMAVGRGQYPPEWVGDVLTARDRRKAGPTAIPAGLYFLGPSYPARFAIPSPRGRAADGAMD